MSSRLERPRPGIVRRSIERIGLGIARILRPLIPPRYRAVATDAVARTLLAAALAQTPGVHIVESEQIA